MARIQGIALRFCPATTAQQKQNRQIPQSQVSFPDVPDPNAPDYASLSHNAALHRSGRSHSREAGSVQPQLSDVPRIRAQLVAFHALDDAGQHGIGVAGEADLLALANHKAVEEFDFRAPALLHVLAHRGPLLGGGLLAVLEALLGAGTHRRLVAFAGTLNRLGRQMQDLLQLIAVRLANADGFAAEPGGEAADRFALQHRSAGKTSTGGEAVAHAVGDQFRPALAP